MIRKQSKEMFGISEIHKLGIYNEYPIEEFIKIDTFLCSRYDLFFKTAPFPYGDERGPLRKEAYEILNEKK